MRFISLFFVIFFVGACATQGPTSQPQPQPDPERTPWVPSAPDRAVVVFNDDSSAASEKREASLALSLRGAAIDGFNSKGYDAVDDTTMTVAFLKHSGRRSANEVEDSLPMLNGWGYAMSLSYRIKSEQSGQYRKVWLTVFAKLYDIRKQSLVMKWEQKQPRHVVVALDCDQLCITQALLPQGEALIEKILLKADYLISKPAKPDSINVDKPETTPPPKEEPYQPGEKGQWQPINF